MKIGKDKNLLAQRGIEQIKGILENAEKDEIEEIAKMVLEKFKELSEKMQTKEEKGELAQEFTNLLVQQEEIPNDVPLEYINAMIKEEEIPNEYIIEPAKDLPDSKLAELTQSKSIPIDDKRELIDSIEDEEIKQEQQEKLHKEEQRIIDMKKRRAMDSLIKIYNTCDKEDNDYDVLNKVNEALISENAEYLSQEEIERIKAKIIAKRIAHNMNRFGATPLSYLSKILSVRDMKKLGIIDMAIEEYENIEEKNKKFDKITLAKNIETMGEEEKEKETKDTEEDEFQKIKYGLLKLTPEERKKAIKEINEYISSKINQNSKENSNISDKSVER